MTFSIIEEKEDELKVLLDCGDYFFKKQNKIIMYIFSGLLFILTFYFLLLYQIFAYSSSFCILKRLLKHLLQCK